MLSMRTVYIICLYNVRDDTVSFCWHSKNPKTIACATNTNNNNNNDDNSVDNEKNVYEIEFVSKSDSKKLQQTSNLYYTAVLHLCG